MLSRHIVYQLMATFEGYLTVFISLNDDAVILFVLGLDELTFETVLLAIDVNKKVYANSINGVDGVRTKMFLFTLYFE